MERTIYLYLVDMPEGVNNDKPDDNDVVYFEGIIESVDDGSCDKLSLLAEIKKAESLLMRKTYNDLLEHNNGNYCKNHVLIDVLLMYKTYVELVDDSAFGVNILKYCVDQLTYIFKLFRIQSRIIIVLPSHINWEEDYLSALLKHLLHNSIIEIASK
ncbi:P18 [Spodoptera eridania nucleopolyhedrovirus]|jgi:hypothetical protein|uniref:P18 n=1 Tax=Spodoptera eridania nucleopolyhedrovirus TaxID=2315721 RepID=A0A346TQ15_9ABAC|nr:hypothetical protein SlnV2_gp077 [Spodoptera litura nucleopolyhedrovirus II]YP_010087078.1 P18 [Spodoptera eridania nucleopolyhedrovirus]ACI47445.1 unknown [Spodoptera litura nucleopolyhedrovirus II]AXU41675.1 P18 [Spodoptera eridania nucleopolyhedrovirus]